MFDNVVKSFSDVMKKIGFSMNLYEQCVGKDKFDKEKENGNYIYLSNNNIIVVTFIPKEKRVKIFINGYLDLCEEDDDDSFVEFEANIKKFDGSDQKYQQVINMIKWIEYMDFPAHVLL